MSLATDAAHVDILDVRTAKGTPAPAAAADPAAAVALQLPGHVGYTFSCDWSPDGRLLATGNEDHTARVFDLRRSTPAALHVLPAHMAAVRAVRFAPDGHALAVMEETDFATLYDVPSAFTRRTTIDFFGETAGIDFSPDSRYCYIGCGEPERGGIIELARPDSLLTPTLGLLGLA